MKRMLLLLLGVLTLAQAQTSSDPNEGLLVTNTGTSGAFTLSWWGVAGRTYFVQQSDDLIHWNYAPVIEAGADDVIEWGFTSSADRCFLRLRYTDVATDDPINADFDGDGLSNYAELMAGTDPFVDDAGADIDSDGLTNAEEYWLGTKLGQAADMSAAAAASVGLVVHTDIH